MNKSKTWVVTCKNTTSEDRRDININRNSQILGEWNNWHRNYTLILHLFPSCMTNFVSFYIGLPTASYTTIYVFVAMSGCQDKS